MKFALKVKVFWCRAFTWAYVLKITCLYHDLYGCEACCFRLCYNFVVISMRVHRFDLCVEGHFYFKNSNRVQVSVLPAALPLSLKAPPLFEAPSYHTAYDSVAMATNFTDPPCESDGSLLPLHRLLIRLHFHFLLRFSSDRRLPIFPVRKARTLQKAWALIVANANETIPNLEESYGIKLGNFYIQILLLAKYQ